ncbi:MAG: hypothetical protein ACRC9S_07530 [Vibrio sp.]
MAKRLCKLSRSELVTSLGEIERLVVSPQFLCRSCARVAADKKYLCKPQSLSSQALATAANTKLSVAACAVEPKKGVTKQQKFDKKLEKLLKRQRKLIKKQHKLASKVEKIHPQRTQPSAQPAGMH